MQQGSIGHGNVSDVRRVHNRQTNRPSICRVTNAVQASILPQGQNQFWLKPQQPGKGTPYGSQEYLRSVGNWPIPDFMVAFSCDQ